MSCSRIARGIRARPVLELLAHRALNPPPSSSLAVERRLRSLLLRAAARDYRRSQLGVRVGFLTTAWSGRLSR
jgi:hypothetical protein